MNRENCDSSGATEKPAASSPDGIEVTPAMIEAGCVAAFKGGFPNEPTDEELWSLVRRVYRAMRDNCGYSERASDISL
jgi:hypothetical protein